MDSAAAVSSDSNAVSVVSAAASAGAASPVAPSSPRGAKVAEPSPAGGSDTVLASAAAAWNPAAALDPAVSDSKEKTRGRGSSKERGRG